MFRFQNLNNLNIRRPKNLNNLNIQVFKNLNMNGARLAGNTAPAALQSQCAKGIGGKSRRKIRPARFRKNLNNLNIFKNLNNLNKKFPPHPLQKCVRFLRKGLQQLLKLKP